MPPHDPQTRWRYELAHARDAVEMARGRIRDDLGTDRPFAMAIVRLLDILGMHDRIAEGNDMVNLDVVWSIVRDDLPPMILMMEELIQADEEYLRRSE